MSIYISPNNEYPRFQGDIKLENPTWEVGQELPTGWIAVEEVVVPDYSTDEVLEEKFPVEENGIWYRSWNVRKMTSEEKARRDAPKTAKQKLLALGLTEAEIEVIKMGAI